MHYAKHAKNKKIFSHGPHGACLMLHCQTMETMGHREKRSHVPHVLCDMWHKKKIFLIKGACFSVFYIDFIYKKILEKSCMVGLLWATGHTRHCKKKSHVPHVLCNMLH